MSEPVHLRGFSLVHIFSHRERRPVVGNCDLAFDPIKAVLLFNRTYRRITVTVDSSRIAGVKSHSRQRTHSGMLSRT
jgi:hypothetical protein